MATSRQRFSVTFQTLKKTNSCFTRHCFFSMFFFFLKKKNMCRMGLFDDWKGRQLWWLNWKRKRVADDFNIFNRRCRKHRTRLRKKCWQSFPRPKRWDMCSPLIFKNQERRETTRWKICFFLWRLQRKMMCSRETYRGVTVLATPFKGPRWGENSGKRKTTDSVGLLFRLGHKNNNKSRIKPMEI